MPNANPTIEDKFNAFCGWVQQITGRPVLKARRRMTSQLNVPYCSVDLLFAKMVPKDLKWYDDPSPLTVDQPLHEIIRGLMMVQFQVTALGGQDAMQVIHRLHASFRTDRFLVFSHQNSFGLSETEGMENLASEFLSAAFENRAQMKVGFYIPVPVTFDEDYFTWGEMTVVVQNIPANNVVVDLYGRRYDE